MPEKPKEKREIGKDKNDEREKASWSEDQRTREYYYDDAHGYEIYHPDDDDPDLPEKSPKDSKTDKINGN